jgi:NADPH:quinone reductase-like Zn-dependent oxidoreductase
VSPGLPSACDVSRIYAAYQTLIVLGEPEAGEHILIHAAACGIGIAASNVGIAAIQLARLFARRRA